MNVQTVSFQGLSFISVEKPTDFEIKYLKNTYHFNPLNLDDYMLRTQIPKIENHKRYNLVVLRFPLFTENSPQTYHQYGVSLPILHTPNKKKRLVSSYVNFFISKDYVVVLHAGELPQVNQIFTLCQKTLHDRTDYMSQGPVFLAYKIIDALINDCFPAINEITTTIDGIDKELEEKSSQKTLEDISMTRRNLVVFHTMVKPMIPLFNELQQGKHEELNGSMQPFWGNSLDHLEKIWDRVEDNQELIEGISKSNESLLAARSNEIVKFLTIITSVAFPFVVMNNLYSMNIKGLPYAQNDWIVWVMFAIMLGGGLSMLLFFKFRKWL